MRMTTKMKDAIFNSLMGKYEAQPWANNTLPSKHIHHAIRVRLEFVPAPPGGLVYPI